MSVGLRAILLGFVGAGVGCSFLVDTSGFISGSDGDGGGLDGTVLVDSSADVTGDAPVGDASDGGADAPFVCPGVFCDSFNRASAQVLTGWTSIDRDDASTVDIDPARGSVAPPALHTVVGMGNGTAGAAGMYKVLDSVASTIRFAFSVRADVNIARHTHMAVIHFGKPTAVYVFLLFPQTTGTVMLASQTTGPSGVFVPVKQNLPWDVNGWHRYDLTVTTGPQPKGVLEVDGAKIYDGSLPHALVAPAMLSIGPNYTMAGPRTELWYDDVVLDLK